jgi:hypothetical protein
VARLQALKIAAGFPNVPAILVSSAFAVMLPLFICNLVGEPSDGIVVF